MAFFCPCIPTVKLKNDDVDDYIEAAYQKTVVDEDCAMLSSKIMTIENYDAYVLPNNDDRNMDDLVLMPSVRSGQEADYIDVVVAGEGSVRNESNQYLYYRADATEQ